MIVTDDLRPGIGTNVGASLRGLENLARNIEISAAWCWSCDLFKAERNIEIFLHRRRFLALSEIAMKGANAVFCQPPYTFPSSPS